MLSGISSDSTKPGNIIISEDGYLTSLDFALAKLSAEGEVGSELATAVKAGTILGTVGYMSPEQAMVEAADFRSDQFSLGLVSELTLRMLILGGIGRLPVRIVVHLKGGLHQDHPKTLSTSPAGEIRPLQGIGSAL